jgi:hypothetical protein
MTVVLDFISEKDWSCRFVCRVDDLQVGQYCTFCPKSQWETREIFYTHNDRAKDWYWRITVLIEHNNQPMISTGLNSLFFLVFLQDDAYEFTISMYFGKDVIQKFFSNLQNPA